MDSLEKGLADCLDLGLAAVSRCADFALAHPLAATFMAFSAAWIMLGFTQVRN